MGTAGFVFGGGVGLSRRRRKVRCCVEESKEATVLVVGGGPAGLGSAIALAREGWKNVVVVEKAPSSGVSDVTREYSYLLGKRALDFAREVKFLESLEAASTAVQKSMLVNVLADGTQNSIELPETLMNGLFITRPRLLETMRDELQRLYSSSVSIHFGTVCDFQVENNNKISVVLCDVESGECRHISPSLVLGCDGQNSSVRTALCKIDPDSFSLRTYYSPSAGLRYKTLRINVELQNVEPNNWNVYTAKKPSKKGALRLGLLPVTDSASCQSALIVQPESHQIWQLKTADEVYSMLEDEFPQLDIRKVIQREDMERFASATPGVLPRIQRTPSLQRVVGGLSLVLLGDAAHTCPPDIGEGANCALEDIAVFTRFLRDGRNEPLADVIKKYESERTKDVEALVRITQYAAPYQYGQDKQKAFFHSIEVAVRMLLNKALPQIFHPHVVFLVKQLPYSEALQRDRETKKNMTILVALLTFSVTGVIFTVGK